MKIRIGYTGNSNPGTIRYINKNFQGYNGSEWVSFSNGCELVGDLFTARQQDITNPEKGFYEIKTSINKPTLLEFMLTIGCGASPGYEGCFSTYHILYSIKDKTFITKNKMSGCCESCYGHVIIKDFYGNTNYSSVGWGQRCNDVKVLTYKGYSKVINISFNRQTIRFDYMLHNCNKNTLDKSGHPVVQGTIAISPIIVY